MKKTKKDHKTAVMGNAASHDNDDTSFLHQCKDFVDSLSNGNISDTQAHRYDSLSEICDQRCPLQRLLSKARPVIHSVKCLFTC